MSKANLSNTLNFAICTLGLSLAVAATAQPARAQASLVEHGTDGVQNRYLVFLEDDLAREDRISPESTSVARRADALLEEHGGQRIATWEQLIQGFVMETNRESARSMARDPRVRQVRQDRYLKPLPGPGSLAASRVDGLSQPLTASSPQTILCPDPDPNDPNACPDNWGLDLLDEPDLQPGNFARDGLYSFGATGAGVHVYLLDTGIDLDDPELSGRISDFFHQSTNGINDCSCISHGTRVAGVVGGTTYGVAKDVILHPVKINTICETPSESTVLSGLDWVAQHVTDNQIDRAVLNISFNEPKNGSTFPTQLSDLVRDLINSYGVVVTVSAGNREGDPADYSPSDVEEAIVVGGIDPAGLRWRRRPSDPDYANLCPGPGGDCGSNYGDLVDLWAPAAYVRSAINEEHHGVHPACGQPPLLQSGTSFAAPHVAGLAALYLETHPNATPAEVAGALVGSATNVGDITGDGVGDLLAQNLFTLCGEVVANDDAFATPRDTRLNIANLVLLANDQGSGTWVNMDTLCNATDPAHGNLICSGSIFGFSYQPDPGFVGIDSFPYTIFNNQGCADTAMIHVTVTGDGTLFEDGFDSGNTSAWPNANTAGQGTLEVTGEAALAGPFGLAACVAGDPGDRARVVDFSPEAESVYRARFHFSAEEGLIAEGNDFRLFLARSELPLANVLLVRVRKAGGEFHFTAQTVLDDGSWVTSSWRASSGPTTLEVEWFAGGAIAEQGGLRFWVNDVLVDQRTGLDNDQQRIDRALLGVVNGVDPGTQGCFYLDQFVSFRTLK